MLRKIVLIIVLAATMLSLAGCQTIQGFGRDITWISGGGSSSRR
jgi:predicted small secreted protein